MATQGEGSEPSPALPRRDFLRRMVGTAGLLPVTPLAHMAEVAGGKASPPDLSPFVTLADFEAAARERMPESVFAYVSSGAADEITLRRNLESYQRILLDARVLADVGQLDLSTKLLSRRLASPVLFAPTASNAAVHRGGEVAVARGAGRTGTTYVLSTSSNTAVEDVTRAASEPVWFQLYVHPDLTAAMDLIRRAEAAGCEAICVTVDTPLPGLRDRQARAEFDPRAGGLTYPHLDWAQARSPTAKRKPGEPRRLVWDEIARLARQTRVPLLLKGIMHHDDARRAIDVGAAGVIVSNHGGRSIDTLPATIEALPGIVAAVGGRIPVLMDGGIRRGTDVVKAIALGATAVLIGRPYLYGLAVAGADGVARVQEILLGELRHSLALLGRPSIASLDRSALWQTPAQLEGSLRGQTAAPR